MRMEILDITDEAILNWRRNARKKSANMTKEALLIRIQAMSNICRNKSYEDLFVIRCGKFRAITKDGTVVNFEWDKEFIGGDFKSLKNEYIRLGLGSDGYELKDEHRKWYNG